jgi:hypothetical protein
MEPCSSVGFFSKITGYKVVYIILVQEHSKNFELLPFSTVYWPQKSFLVLYLAALKKGSGFSEAKTMLVQN